VEAKVKVFAGVDATDEGDEGVGDVIANEKVSNIEKD
jgi:hypothetical protein